MLVWSACEPLVVSLWLAHIATLVSCRQSHGMNGFVTWFHPVTLQRNNNLANRSTQYDTSSWKSHTDRKARSSENFTVFSSWSQPLGSFAIFSCSKQKLRDVVYGKISDAPLIELSIPRSTDMNNAKENVKYVLCHLWFSSWENKTDSNSHPIIKPKLGI